MKKNKKLMATLLVFALMLLTCVGSLSVFASEDKSDETTTVAVSGCDLKVDDLVKVEVKQYGFSMLVPNGNLTTIESPTENFANVGYSRHYFMEQGCVMQVFTDKENYCAVSFFVEELSSIHDYYGNYNSLSKAQQDELIADSISDGNASAEFVKINGRNYLKAYVTDNSEGDVYAQYQFTTVINGQKYMLYIQTVNSNDADSKVINEMIKSIKINGMSIVANDASMSVTDIVLIVVCLVLALAVALAYFFLYRISEFTKAGVEGFAIIGFDMPNNRRKDPYGDDDDEEFDDEEDDEDDEEDDEDEDEEDEDSDEADEVEEDSDDERIIKD